MTDKIFTKWTSDITAKWGKAPLKAAHRLDTHPLFSLDALADLIDGYPRQHYALVSRIARKDYFVGVEIIVRLAGDPFRSEHPSG